MFGQLINYWNLTGDTTYNEKIMEAMLFQIGDDKNYMPQNQSKALVRKQTRRVRQHEADALGREMMTRRFGHSQQWMRQN